jgi:hypothetical protein
MMYEVIVDSVTPGFRNSMIAAVVTLTQRIVHEGGIIIGRSLGPGFRECGQLVDAAPVAILREFPTLCIEPIEEAERAKRSRNGLSPCGGVS